MGLNRKQHRLRAKPIAALVTVALFALTMLTACGEPDGLRPIGDQTTRPTGNRVQPTGVRPTGPTETDPTETDPTATRSGGDQTTGGASSGASTVATTTTPVKPRHRKVAWIPFGPASPSSPDAPMRVYANIQADCTSSIVLQESMRGSEAAFWLATAHACAALRGTTVDDDEWQQAKQAWLRDGGSQYTGGGCLAASARSFMRSVAQAAGPSFDSSLVSLSGTKGGYACTPRNLEISPDHGPAGTSVTITWEGASWLGTAGQAITFGDQPSGIESETAGSVTVGAPTQPEGSDPEATVPVRLDFGSHGQLSAGQFTYESETTASSATSSP